MALVSAARDWLAGLGFGHALQWGWMGNFRADRLYPNDPNQSVGARTAYSVQKRGGA